MEGSHMGLVKQDTQLIPVQKMFRVGHVHPTWEMHPDWIQALRNLDTYNQWVCEIVMPIVFDWIQDHYAEVYKDMPDGHKDDMGVVIEKAFQIVSERSSYKDGVKNADAYEARVKSKNVDLAKTNPVWQEMSKALDQARENVRDKFRKMFLPNSVRPADAPPD
jgi:hypothetical protein